MAARSKNKHIRTVSLSNECLEALARHRLSHESKSATVERLIMAQVAFVERMRSRQQYSDARRAAERALADPTHEPAGRANTEQAEDYVIVYD